MRFILKKCHPSQWKALSPCLHHAADSTYLTQAGSHPTPYKSMCIFKAERSLQLYMLGLTAPPDNKKRMGVGEGQGQNYCLLSVTVKLFTHVVLKVDLL